MLQHQQTTHNHCCCSHHSFALFWLIVSSLVLLCPLVVHSLSSSVTPPSNMISKNMITSMATAQQQQQQQQQRVLFLHWFRLGDLRLHDNPALCQTLANAAKTHHATTATTTATATIKAAVLPIFVFDTTSIFGSQVQTPFGGGWKCGPRRAKFILESVLDLKQSLEQQGSGLLVHVGKPDHVMTQLLQSIHNYKQQQQQQVGGGVRTTTSSDSTSTATTSATMFLPKVFCQDEVCSEERDVERAVKGALKRYHPKATLETVWGSTLYHVDELPYDKLTLADMPDVFTPFRTKVEKNCRIHPPLPTPTASDWKDVFPTSLYQYLLQQPSSSYSSSSFPTLLDLGYTAEEVEQANYKDHRASMEFRGGERQALLRVQQYIWTNDRLKDYFDTRNGMLHADDSSKFSPWLAHGCLSPRMVALQCQKYEQERVTNKSTYWLVFELLWRDFFKFFALKHGSDIFQPYGITAGQQQEKTKWVYNAEWIQAWKDGMTGYPLVDANMRELAATGYMSNRGRQNVCSFLALDLAQDWRYGAYYFESLLLDYDVYSNYGNWCSGAGMTGGRINRFNIIKQSKDYDQHGEYLRHWLPKLRKVPTEFIHEPWKMNQFQQVEYECQLGVEYPNPIIPPSNFRSVPPGAADPSRRQGGGGRKGKQSGDKDSSGQKRTSGQRQDMKSLKTGTYRIGDKI